MPEKENGTYMLSLPKGLFERLRKHAEKENLPVSEFARQILEDHLLLLECRHNMGELFKLLKKESKFKNF